MEMAAEQGLDTELNKAEEIKSNSTSKHKKDVEKT
jgi:hypothetical protein